MTEKPDFNGKWLFVKHENFEAFMAENGEHCILHVKTQLNDAVSVFSFINKILLDSWTKKYLFEDKMNVRARWTTVLVYICYVEGFHCYVIWWMF